MKKFSVEVFGGVLWVALMLFAGIYASLDSSLGADFRPSNPFEEFVVSLLPDRSIASREAERDAPKTPMHPPQVAILPDRPWLAGVKPSEFRDDRRRANSDPHARRYADAAKRPPQRPGARV